VRAQQARPAHRAIIGALLAVSSTGLAITAHGLAGGGFPDTALVIPITALIAWAGTALAGRLRGPVALLATVAVIQLGLHELLDQSAYAHGGHESPPAVNGAAMLAGHVAATLIVAALLARASAGLAAFASLLDRLRGRLEVLRLAPVPAAIGPTLIAAVRPGPLIEIVLRRVSARRGPPRLLLNPIPTR
jgi:hypothetical protein